MARIEGSLEVSHVSLNEELKEKLISHFTSELDRAINIRNSERENWEQWIAQYNGRQKRSVGSPRDAQIDTTASCELAQQIRARVLNPIFQQEQLMTTKPRIPGKMDDARAIERVADFITDKVPMMRICDHWFRTAEVLPFGIVKVGWTVETRKVKEWKEVPVLDELGQPDVDPMTGEPMTEMKEVEREITEWVGSKPKNIHSKDFFFPAYASEVKSSPWIAEQFWSTESEVKSNIKNGIYGTMEGKKFKKVDFDKLGEPIEEEDRLDLEGKERDRSDEDGLFQAFEIYASYDVDDDGIDEEIVLTLDKRNSAILRCVYNWWHDYPRPYVDFSFEENPGTIDGVSLMYRIESEHRLYAAQRQQRLDNASKCNQVALFVKPGTDLKKVFKNGLDGVHEVQVSNFKEDLYQFQLAYPLAPATELSNLGSQALVHMRDVVGITPYLQGLETINRPTATGQSILVEEGKQALFLLLERFREKLALVVKMMLARYKQFYPQGLEVYNTVIDPGVDVGLEQTLVQWPEGAIDEAVFIETKVSSSTMSKQMKKQESLAMVDKAPQIFGTMMQMGEAAMSPTPLAPLAQEILMKYMNAVRAFFIDFDMNLRELLPNVEESIQGGQQIMQILQENMALKAQMGIPPEGGMGPEAGGAPPNPQGGGGNGQPPPMAPNQAG